MKFRIRLVLCAIVFAIAISAKQLLPQLTTPIKMILFGRGDDPVTQACCAFKDSLNEHEDLKDCVFAFCSELYEKD